MSMTGLSITILGSGTCTPSPYRQPAGYLLCHNDKRYLIDSGSGTISRLAALGISVIDLDAIFYTHIHLDHTGDLFPLLFTMKNAYGKKRSRPLSIYGPPGFLEFFNQLFRIYERWTAATHYALHVRELNPADRLSHLVDQLNVGVVRMNHSVSAIGYRFCDASGHAIAVTGDADDSPELIELCRGVDLVVADCSTPDELKMSGHLSPTPLGKACQKAGCGMVVLSHLYPPSDETDIESAVRRHFDGVVSRAVEGCTYHVNR